MRTLLARTALLLGLAFAAAAQAQPTVTTPGATCNWCDISVTWSGIVSPSPYNILKLTTPGSTNAINWRFTNGASSGTLPLSVPGAVAFGSYVVQLVHQDASTILATSAPFQVVPTVSGTVTSGGSPLAGVSIAGTNGAQCNAITDASGGWGCLVPYGWSGTITPSKPGSLFSPASRSYTNVTDHINSNNFATAPSHAVSGTITFDGSPLSGAALAGSNGAICTATNASGEYACAVAPGWSGTVTPSMADRVFAPASRSYTNVTAAQPSQDYTANATFYQVSGSVTLNGLALANVALAATGGPTCTSTDGAGQYSCTVAFGWSGSVTPSASGYSFGPASRSFTSVSSNQTAQTFTATLDSASAPLYFVDTDHLNTPRLIADDQQRTVWRWDQQEPFGNNPPDENPSGLGAFEFPMRFPGQYADKETNLHYNYFRDCYDSAIGRFCQSDPIGLGGGLNTYSYAVGNALSYADPSGEIIWVPLVIGAAIVAGSQSTTLQSAAENAAQFWADRQVGASNPISAGAYGVLGALAVLADPCTINKTATVLGLGSLTSGAAASIKAYQSYKAAQAAMNATQAATNLARATPEQVLGYYANLMNSGYGNMIQEINNNLLKYGGPQGAAQIQAVNNLLSQAVANPNTSAAARQALMALQSVM